MTPAAIITAIESLSTFELARLLKSPDFWDVLGRDRVVLGDAAYNRLWLLVEDAKRARAQREHAEYEAFVQARRAEREAEREAMREAKRQAKRAARRTRAPAVAP